MKPKFHPAETKVAYTTPAYLTGPVVPVYSYPVTPKKGVRAALSREPLWQVVGLEEDMFIPRANPDNVARSFILDGSEHTIGFNGDGCDMFGIKWEYVAQAGGCMVRPGNPLLTMRTNGWIKSSGRTWIPGTGRQCADSKRLSERDTAVSCCFNGWFERLLSFMNTENALLA
jgi:hypothetical protein